MTTHNLAISIATALVRDPALARVDVYLDAIPESVDLSRRTVAVVSPASSAHPRGGATHTVRVAIIHDSGGSTGNAASPEKSVDGFWSIGCGAGVDALLQHVRRILATWTLGVVPVEQGIEYDLASLPFQAGVVEATFNETKAFGDE